MFTDVLVTFLPVPLIWNLNLPTRQRVAVISIFALGIVVDVAGSVRTVYVWKSMIASYDTTWVGWPVLLAATVEINIGLVCQRRLYLLIQRSLANFNPRLVLQRLHYDLLSHSSCPVSLVPPTDTDLTVKVVS